MIQAATCPICNQPVTKADGSVSDALPFCSKRCQQVDLYRWFSDKYAIVENLGPERLAQELFEAEEHGGTSESEH